MTKTTNININITLTNPTAADYENLYNFLEKQEGKEVEVKVEEPKPTLDLKKQAMNVSDFLAPEKKLVVLKDKDIKLTVDTSTGEVVKKQPTSIPTSQPPQKPSTPPVVQKADSLFNLEVFLAYLKAKHIPYEVNAGQKIIFVKTGNQQLLKEWNSSKKLTEAGYMVMTNMKL